MKPNIIYIMADQMRGSAMGKGDECVFTPNLDGFADEGIQFTRAVSNTPVCGPVRASILTGLHTLGHELVNNDKALRTDVRTIAHCLGESGYKCGYIGKWHMDCADRGAYIPPGPRRQGFDDYWAAYNCNHNYFDGYYYLNDSPEPVWIEGYEPFEQTNIAVEYIKKRSKEDNPFCLFLSFGPPHCPYETVPGKYKDLYPTGSIKLRENASADADLNKIAGYYAHITALDECFGKILNAVEQAGLRDDTLIIFSSDHGDMLYSQNRGWKCKPWRESVIVPLIARWPKKIPAGLISKKLISLTDIMPTLLSIAGAEIPKETQGKDMSALFWNDISCCQKSVFINYPVSPDKFSYREWRGVITEKYTYARFKDKPWVLYDDENDPYQLNNLVNNSESKDLLVDMEKLLNQWMVTLNDPFETSEEVASRYYKGSIAGVMPYYENDKIKSEKEARKKARNENLG